MHTTERRTVLGIDCLYWALVLDLVLVLATFLVSVVVIPGFFVALKEGRDPMALVPHLPCMVVYLGASLVFGLATVILFFAGFLDLHAGRTEFGGSQEKRIVRARLSLVATVVLSLAFAVLPRGRPMVLGMPDTVLESPDWALLARVILSAFVALFAGLTLVNSVYGLTDRAQRSRLRTAVVLGVVAALAGSVFGIVGIASGSVELLILSILSGAIAGEGVAAISLVLFLLAFRDIRRGLRRGWALSPIGP